MTTPTTANLEHDLARARPRLMALAADLASGGDRSTPVPPHLTAAALDTVASMANALAVDLRGEKALR